MRVVKIKGTIAQVIKRLNKLTNEVKQTNSNATLLDLCVQQKESKQC